MPKRILPHLLMQPDPVCPCSSESYRFTVHEYAMFTDIIHRAARPSVASCQRQVEPLSGECGITGRHTLGDQPYVVEFIGVGVSDHKEKPVQRDRIGDLKGVFRNPIGSPGMTWYGLGLFQDAVACAGDESHRIESDGNADGAFFHDDCFVRNYEMRTMPFPNPATVCQSTFSTCSLAFSSSSFINTTLRWMSAS